MGAARHPGSLPCPGILGIKVLLCKCPCVRIQRPGADGRRDGDRSRTCPPAASIAPQFLNPLLKGLLDPLKGATTSSKTANTLKKGTSKYSQPLALVLDQAALTLPPFPCLGALFSSSSSPPILPIPRSSGKQQAQRGAEREGAAEPCWPGR